MNINASTRIFGVIGYPLSHTFSPAMHNAAFAASGYNAVYLAFQVKNLLQLKHSLNQLNISGLSVTIPHKVAIRRLLDQIDPLALQIGSVNTVVKNAAGLWEGYNTDGRGAVQAIEETGFELAGKNILIIGSGGSARGIAFALLEKQPGRITLLGRNRHKLQQLARNLRLAKNHTRVDFLLMPDEKGPGPNRLQGPEQLESHDLIIHTTPVGMKNHPLQNELVLPAEYLFRHQVLFDIVYNPQKTPLVAAAQTRKLGIIYGYKMLLYQGALQFQYFTSLPAPVAAMEKALLAEIKKQQGAVS